MRNSEVRTALLISGSGTTADAVMQAVETGALKGITIAGVISSRPDAPGIEKAKARQVPAYVVERQAYGKDRAAFGAALLTLLRSLGVDFVSQNGWLPLTPEAVIAAYQGRIINQHPGPLDPGRPDFGGKGMFGSRVTAARLAYIWTTRSVPWTESTVHHVTEEYDRGALISVTRLTVPAGPDTGITIAQLRRDPAGVIDTTKAVQRELLALEHDNVIRVLAAVGEGTVPVYQRTEPLVPDTQAAELEAAKQLAVQLFPEG